MTSSRPPLNDRDQVLAGLDSVSRVERQVCGFLVRRQVQADPRFDRAFARYGPSGTLAYFRGRAIHVYLLGVALLSIASIVADMPVLAWSIFGLGFGLGGPLALYRYATATRFGRTWRRSDVDDDLDDEDC